MIRLWTLADLRSASSIMVSVCGYADAYAPLKYMATPEPSTGARTFWTMASGPHSARSRPRLRRCPARVGAVGEPFAQGHVAAVAACARFADA
jgi:hypothetical protein